MTAKWILLAAFGLAAGLANAGRSGAEWVSFETAAGVRAGDGSRVHVAFLPTQECRPRVSIALDPAARTQPGPGLHDVTDLRVTLRVDGHLPWRADLVSIYAADGAVRAGISDVHPDLIAELSGGKWLDLGHTTASLHGAGEALDAARHACRLALEDARPLPGTAASRVALSP